MNADDADLANSVTLICCGCKLESLSVQLMLYFLEITSGPPIIAEIIEQRAEKTKKLRFTSPRDELQFAPAHQRFSQFNIRKTRDHFEKPYHPPHGTTRRLAKKSAQSKQFNRRDLRPALESRTQIQATSEMQPPTEYRPASRAASP